MMIVTVILTLIAGTVIPRVTASIQSNEFRRSVQKLETAVNRAHAQAATDGQIHTIGFDPSTQALTDTVGESDAPTSTPLGADWSMSESQLDQSQDKQNELSIRFYPDGTADATTSFFKANDTDITLRVTTNGIVTVTRGRIETTGTQEWAAGDLEQRGVQN